jgi:hypothetical protein
MKSCTYVVLWGVILLLTLVAGCKENPVEVKTPSTISGIVMREDNSQAVIGAIVVDIGARGAIDTSDQAGAYALPLGVLSSQYSTTLITTAMGYFADTLAVTVPQGEDLNVNIRMRRDSSQPVINGISGRASSITLVSQTAKTIALRGTGSNESSTLTFLVVDSLNSPVVAGNRCWVKFYISASHYSGEYVRPTLVQTDARGEVSTSVFSGTEPNVIQVFALVVDSTRTDTVKASPVSLTSGGGFPDGRYVSIVASQYNIAGRVFDGLTTNITMSVSDRYGNPVADGTQVSFRSTAGIITSSVGTRAGVATAELKSGGARPAAPGLVTVTAETKGDSSYNRADSLIVRTIQILFSGYPTIALDSNAINFEVPDGDMNYFDYTVSDDYGMPLVQGSTINVTVDAANDALKSSIKLENNEITMTDSRNPNSAHFRLYVYDKNKDGLSGPIWFNITVTSQNYSGSSGTYTITRWFYGYMRGTVQGGGGGYYGVPASISLADSTARSLYLNETQLPDTSTRITFVVKDGTGNPYTASHLFVTFSLQSAPAGTYITPLSDSTGAGGLVSVTVNSGNVPGIARVLATTIYGANPPFTALSMPIEVAHGLPDSNQIIMNMPVANMYNSPGIQVGTVRLSVADIWGNFPPPQYIRFSTSGGVLSPAAVLLDSRGGASTALYGGSLPVDPVRGFGNVSAFIAVHGGATVTRKTPFLFSGAPVVTTLNVPASDTINIFDGSYYDVNFRVADANRIPLAAGNNVIVTTSGLVAGSIRLSDDVNFNTDGTVDTNNTVFRVRVSDAVSGGGDSGPFDVTIAVNGPNGTTTRRFHGYLYGVGAIIPPTASAKLPAQIAIAANSPSSSDIYVSGVGALEKSVITYQVLDSLGSPIEREHRAFATFQLLFFPNTFTHTGTDPTFLPTSDSTDNSGYLRVLVASGTQAGIIQVVASIDLGGGKVVQSQPVRISVHAGFPDQRHFTLAAQQFNFPGLDKAFVTDNMVVQVVDKYSNPVLPGTAVYFNTTHGGVETGNSQSGKGITDLDGFVKQNLYSGNPFPEGADTLPSGPGWAWLYARTMGEDSATVIDSILMLWTGAPIITITSGPATFAIPDAGSAGPWTFTVQDRFGHPMSPGTVISAVADGCAVDGNANITMPDTFSTGSGFTDFTVLIKDANPSDTDPNAHPSVLYVVVNHPIYGTYKVVLAQGSVQ